MIDIMLGNLPELHLNLYTLKARYSSSHFIEEETEV